MLPNELRQALRSLGNDHRFTLVAALTLGLGVGACTAIFSVLYGVLLNPLPYPDSERLVAVWQVNDAGRLANLSDPNYEDFRDQNRSFEALAQYNVSTVSVAGGSAPARLLAAAVSRGFFEALAVPPRLGRALAREEQEEGGAPVAVVSFGYLQRYLGGDPDLSRHRLRAGGAVLEVVGVMPPGFDFPPGTDLWVARELYPRYPSRTAHNWMAVGRLREEVTLEQARSDLSTIARRLKQQLGDDTWMSDAAVIPLQEEQVGEVRTALWVLMGAVTFLLLVACANVANLLLARVTTRQRELAVRTALGASRWRLVRQFLVESLLLALLGGALGVALAVIGVDLLLGVEPGKLPRVEEIEVSLPVLLFALALSMLTAVGLGLTAALRATGSHMQDSLRESQRAQGGGASGARLRGSLVVAQLAITLVLLLGAGLLGRSLWQLLGTDPGFATRGRLVLDLTHPGPRDDEERRRLGRFQQELLSRLRRLPGVETAGGIDRLPIATGSRNGLFLVMRPGEEPPEPEQFGALALDPTRTGTAEYRAATPGYFRAMGIPLVDGRLFDERDEPGGVHVAVVSESLAAQWPQEEALGKQIEFGNMDGDLRLLTVVGVVGDVRHRGLDQPPSPTIYTNAHQRPPSAFSVVMGLGSGEAATVFNAARDIVRQLDSELPPRFRTIEQVFSSSVADRRFELLLLGAFGLSALLLAAAGIYGVTAYTVSQRTQEIGVRMALGAGTREIFGMVLRQGSVWVVAGVGLGVLGAFLLTRLLASLLFEISPTDPLTYVGVAVGVAGVALLACTSPARRATGVDPMVALREE